MGNLLVTMSDSNLVRLLLTSQFSIKFGFTLLMPYLAGHLTHGLGLTASAVGLILGIRNASQRGLALVGGQLADRFGCRAAVVTGCGLRSVGFGLLAFADRVPALVLASAATGFAGALFDPGIRTMLATVAGDRRTILFGRFNVAGQAGLLLGPLAGLVLAAVDFRMVALAAAAVFAVLTMVQAVAFPAVAVAAPGEDRAGWRRVLRNRCFLVFSLAMAGSYLLPFQIYVTVPLVMGRTLGPEQDFGMGELFALSAVLAIALQGRVGAWAAKRWSPPHCLAAGLVVMALAFVPLVAFPQPVVPSVLNEEVAEHLAMLPMLAGAALLAVGTMLICPFEMDVIVRLSRGRLVATHYGLYSTLSGVATAVGNLLTGLMWESTYRWLPWTAFVALGCGCALGVALLNRRRPLTLA